MWGFFWGIFVFEINQSSLCTSEDKCINNHTSVTANAGPQPSQAPGVTDFANTWGWYKLKQLEGGCHLPLLLVVLKDYWFSWWALEEHVHAPCTGGNSYSPSRASRDSCTLESSPGCGLSWVVRVIACVCETGYPAKQFNTLSSAGQCQSPRKPPRLNGWERRWWKGREERKRSKGFIVVMRKHLWSLPRGNLRLSRSPFGTGTQSHMRKGR